MPPWLGFRFSSTLSLFLLLLSLLLNPFLASTKHHELIQGPPNNITKSLSFQSFTTIQHDNIKLLGSAAFSTKTASIQIPDRHLKHQAGRAIYSSPLRLLDPYTRTPASFETTFSFRFTRNASDDNPGGSGLTFIIVPDELTVGRPGPWLAMMNDACEQDYKAIAIEFDTRRNLEFGDPNDNHVGINLGSIVSSTTVNASDVGVVLNDGSTHRAWIHYNGIQRWLDIRLGSDSGDYPTNSLYSSSLDLSPYLNEYMFVGFSASTGNRTQIHNILSWNFSSISQAFLRLPSTYSCESNLLDTNSAKPPNTFLIFVSVLLLSLAILLGFYCNSKRRNQKSNITSFPEKKQRPRPPHKPRRFTFLEISTATRCFNEGEMLSSSSRGVCYRASVSSGFYSHVAVMRFSTRYLAGVDPRRVVKEISRLSRVKHPNLVNIRGWCCERKEVIVVYDYFQNGSLDRWLYGVGVMPWSRRVKVITDVADSLGYLHSKKMAHKNVKTSSVFLDTTFRAVLGDFGIGELRRAEAAVGQRSDVFEFGIIVLEIVSGRRNEEEEGEECLVDFVWGMHEKGELGKVVDRRIGLVFNLEQAIRVVAIGLACVSGSGRVSMEDVVGCLNDTDSPLPELPMRRPVSLVPYNSATDLCGVYSCAPFR